MSYVVFSYLGDQYVLLFFFVVVLLNVHKTHHLIDCCIFLFLLDVFKQDVRMRRGCLGFVLRSYKLEVINSNLEQQMEEGKLGILD